MSLPVLLSIPHGGTLIPPEVQDIVCVSYRSIIQDVDAYAIPIYDMGDAVQVVLKAKVARTIVDLNRSLRDMPPHHADGLIKNTSCYGEPVYTEFPGASILQTLIQKYYMTYHRAIQRAVRKDIQLCLDCHTMAALPPPVAPDLNSSKRPLFCLSNQNGQTSSMQSINLLAKCLSEAFNIQYTDMQLNDPFLGGHITKTYGNNPLPWIQIEMNRSLYLPARWPDDTPDAARLAEVNAMFGNALRLYFERNTSG